MCAQADFRLEPTNAPVVRFAPAAAAASVELYWLPLGVGGWFVRLSGRIWEAIHAWLEHRRPLDLYHTALVVRVPEGRFVVENCWPIPDGDGPSRGVLVEGPTGAHWLDDPSDLSCQDSTRQHLVDDPLLSCKQQVGGSSPPPAPKVAGQRLYSKTSNGFPVSGTVIP
jgi:hypothetical protein